MSRRASPRARLPRPLAENRTGADGRERGQQRAPVGSGSTAFDARDVLLGKHDDATVAQAVVER